MDARDIGPRLLIRRRHLRRDAADVARRVRVDKSVLFEWERGETYPPLDQFVRWMHTLGLDMEWSIRTEQLSLMPAESAARGLQIDWARRHASIDGIEVRITTMEWKALERLAMTPGELVTHRTLFHHLYGEYPLYGAQSTAVRVLITKLRRLLPVRIEARWGQGYVISGVPSSLLSAPSAPPDTGDTGGDQTSPTPTRAVEAPTANPPKTRPDPGTNTAAASESTSQRGTTTGPKRTESGMAEARASRPNAPSMTSSSMGGRGHSSTPAAPLQRGRAEELEKMERFLAERGVTHCPDLATIASAPLPMLVWDKVKRKWVRPPAQSPTA